MRVFTALCVLAGVLVIVYMVGFVINEDVKRSRRDCQEKGELLQRPWHFDSATGCEIETRPGVWARMN